MHPSDDAARRAFLDRDARLRALPPIERDLILLASDPGFGRWLAQITATGGCAHPVYLAGHTTTRDATTGEILHHYTTADEPGARMPVRCRNRRATRCPPCSAEYQGDTFHLVRAGLTGGKNVPDSVTSHPRLFVTLTAPSFGRVHHVTEDGRPCHPRRDGAQCQHGNSAGCGLHHRDTDPKIGTPLCAACYDYPAHVLWHAHTRPLWDALTRTTRRHLATLRGLTERQLRAEGRVSFAKVAEYQRRGAVHFHVVIRLDGPEGPTTAPPLWASAELLELAVRHAAATVTVTVPHTAALGELILRWGTQLAVRPVRHEVGASLLTDDAVAAYVAKYVTKSLGDAGAADQRIRNGADIERLLVNGHVRTLITTCWRLGGLAELEHLRLRAWAHTAGYRGHCLTKSRRYSTTYTALRAARTEYQRHHDGRLLHADWDDSVKTDATWRYVGTGHAPAEAEIAAGVAEDLARMREIAREVRATGPDD